MEILGIISNIYTRLGIHVSLNARITPDRVLRLGYFK
jgi:hypothetical protein